MTIVEFSNFVLALISILALLIILIGVHLRRLKKAMKQQKTAILKLNEMANELNDRLIFLESEVVK